MKLEEKSVHWTNANQWITENAEICALNYSYFFFLSDFTLILGTINGLATIIKKNLGK